MATYKKTGTKLKKGPNNTAEHSTTAEVFNTLDETASKSEQWIIKNQKVIYGILIAIVVVILGYLAYQKYIQAPKEKEAANELAFPKVYFEDAMSNSVAADSLFTLALEGADGKYGFIDVAEQFSGTKAGNLANYYAGISFLKLKNYQEAISYLENYTSEDELLGPIAKGAIGDAFADINQLDDAYDFYIKAANFKDNNFTSPLFLFKAGNTAMDLGNYNKELDAFNKIKNDYPTSDEAKNIDIYISKAAFASNN
jgi:tetratricopeptide (TPR) repeat protein